MTSIVQYTKAFVAEYVAGAQLNYISFLIALCGLCILFLYYIISSENESKKQHIDHRMEQSAQRMDRRMEQNDQRMDRRMDQKFFQMEQNILSVIRGNVPGNGGNNFVQVNNLSIFEKISNDSLVKYSSIQFYVSIINRSKEI